MESRRRPGSASDAVDAVESEGMDMEVEIQCRSKALEKCDSAALRGPQSPMKSSAPPVFGEEGPQERAEYLTRESRVVGAAVAERVGQRENPLPNRHLRQHPIDQVRCGIRHAASATRWTEPTALAREGDQSIVPAVVAVEAQEAMRQDSAAQERAQLLLDEAGRGLLSASRLCEEGLEVLAYDLVEQGSLGLVALVLDGGAPSRDRVLGGDPSKFGAASRLRCGPSPRPLDRRSCPSGAETSRAVNLEPRAGESPRAQQARGSEAAFGAAEGLSR